jgi:hypothetical protein
MDETKAMVLEPVAAAKPVPQTVPQVIAQTAPKPAPAPQNSLFAEKLQAVLEPHK